MERARGWKRTIAAGVGTAVLGPLLALVVSAPPAAAAGPVRVATYGDSLTQGCSFDSSAPNSLDPPNPDRDPDHFVPSYRHPLFQRLRARGAVDFVGTRSGAGCDQFAGMQTLPGDWTDREHDGYAGWRTDHLLAGKSGERFRGDLDDWLAVTDSDAALLLIGVNDVVQSQQTFGPTEAQIEANIDAIVDRILADTPGGLVFVAELPPIADDRGDPGDVPAMIVAVNAHIRDTVGARARVHTVDLHTGYDPAWSPDGVHPAAAGQQFIADRFGAAVEGAGLFTAACERRWAQAESGVLTGSFAVVTDPAADGGAAVGSPDGSGDLVAPDPAAGSVTLCLEAPRDGRYILKGLTAAPDRRSRSFFVSVDGQGPWKWVLRNRMWVGDKVNDKGVQDPVVLDLTAGPHEVTVSLREDGALLDRIRLVRLR